MARQVGKEVGNKSATGSQEVGRRSAVRVVEAYEVQGLAFREMANEVFGYRKLIAYQKAKEVVKCAYILLQKFPSEEKNAMCDQLRRATVAITSNISEGVSRYSMKEKSHFIEMSSGPLMEVSRLYTLLGVSLGVLGAEINNEINNKQFKVFTNK